MPKKRLRAEQKNASIHADVTPPEISPQTDKNGILPGPIKYFLTYLKSPSHWWLLGIIAFLSLGVLGAGLKYLEDAARDQKVKQSQNPLAKRSDNVLSSLNPFQPAPPPTPNTQLSKEYLYAGSSALAVQDAGATVAPPGDIAIWRPSNGNWYCLGGVGSQTFTVAWGMNGDVPVQGDYDGDGKTDLAIFRPSSGAWWIYRSSDNSYYAFPFGQANDLTVVADYDGDGKSDPAVYRPSTNYWYILQSSNGSTVTSQFGASGDLPKPADYDGDGKSDIAVWRGSSAAFYGLKSTNGQSFSQNLGAGADVPVSGDYDGDGKDDFAIRSGNDWVIRQSSDGTTTTVTWYLSSFVAVPNDYDGDGKVDIAVWKPSGKGVGNWYIRNSHDGSTRIESWGAEGDIPVPALYRR